VAGNSKQLGYPLKQSDEEMRRLTLQVDVLHTGRDALALSAGRPQAGMRVLDVGCGAGDVSLLAAEMAGRDGAVVGH
jgi:ubiquinone/menaquinone biosynthesis C-methylase UbiE